MIYRSYLLRMLNLPISLDRCHSSGSRDRLLAATIAGFLSQSRSTRASELFDNHWRGMVNRIDDPYARVMLSRIGGDGWESILREEAVPILDRVAIAVCNLDDTEVSYVSRTTRSMLTRMVQSSPLFSKSE